MSNDRPLYGQPSQWGQQPAQGNGAYQPPMTQPGYGQQFSQSQAWQPQTYQPQNHQPQEVYAQQSWQPYGQQATPAAQPYGQPQQPYGQPQQPYAQPQQAYAQPQQPYAQPQQPYAQPQQAYAQPQQPYAQPQQPYAQAQQPYAQPQQPYAQAQQPYAQLQQNFAQPQNGYAQPQEQAPAAQNNQPLQQPRPTAQFYPATGYSGYVTQSGDEGDMGNRITLDMVAKVALFGLLPALFILGVLFKWPVVCWMFLAASAGTVALMWLRPVVEANLRLVSSLIIGVLSVVALITALAGPGNAQQNTAGGRGNNQSGQMGGQVTADISWQITPTPAPTPDPYAESGEAAEVLQSFFYVWHVNNDESMLAMTAPSWRNAQQEPLKALFTIRANRTPADDLEIIEISGSELDTTRTARVRVTISKNISGRDPEVLAFSVVMLKEDGQWYVDPRSLASNEVVATTKATNAMATQPVLNTAQAQTVLYYNPSGGSYYHYDPNCGKVGTQYLPLKGQFLYSQLNDAPYNTLKNCTYCGAPLRQ